MKHDAAWAISQLRGWGLKVEHGPREWETTVVTEEIRDGQVQAITTQAWPTDELPAIVEAASRVRFSNAALRMKERLSDVGVDLMDYVHTVGG